MKLIRLILCFFILFALANRTYADPLIKERTDDYVCEHLIQLVVFDQIVLKEAKLRRLNCSSKFNFSIPENSHVFGSSWICNTNFYKSGSKCRKVPANAYSNYNSNEWFCKSNYYKNRSHTSCLSVPKNATKWSNDLGFTCKSDFSKSTSGLNCIANPSTSTTKTAPKISIPNNARKVSNERIDGEWITSGWVCNKNYYRSSDKTSCWVVPANRFSPSDSNKLWKCKSGAKINSSKTGCISDVTQTTDTEPTPKPTPTPAPRTTSIDIGLGEIAAFLIGLFILWLIFKPSPSSSSPRQTQRSQPRQTQRSQARSTPTPKPRSTSSSKYKPPIKPQSKPVPKAQPKSKTTNINNPNLLLIEIGVAVAFIDGNLSDEESTALKGWMTKTYKYDGNSSGSKQLFNETFSDAIKAAKAGNLDIQDICRLLNKKGTKELNKEAFRFAYEIMGADGEIHKNEVKMIKLLEKNLQITADDVTRIRDKFLIKTIIKKDFKIVNLLGLDVSASSRTICRELTKEFSKWNALINQVKTKKERDNIQKLLELLGEAREENDC